ncbi:MAG: DNA-3-methyladenine glycosylase 2 family protein [Clostridia bacterium]|nr:DNA-3-methyladenine glycosylase 2 family protein [Clostridia bacterium]
MKVVNFGNYIKIEDESFFDIFQTFDCGQTFRFEKIGEDVVEGVAHGKLLRMKQTKDGCVEINCTADEFERVWKHYLALDRDYSEINAYFSLGNDEVLKKAALYGKGIHILRQDPWEALCSFIISQNNNIPRIKKIINSLSEKFGEPFEYEGKTYYSFPTAKALAEAGEAEIFALKTGFRAKYICDAAEKVVSGEIDLEKILSLTTSDAQTELLRIKGVGPKVAACALLFGFDKTDAFPIDVWVKRVFSKYYPDGFDIISFGENAGIAQQYLFYYERWQNTNLGKG